MAGHSATYLARWGGYEVKEGAAVEGVAIIEFPTFAEARAWYESPAYQEASQHRFRGGDYDVVGRSSLLTTRPNFGLLAS